jgi:hypothetical protein
MNSVADALSWMPGLKPPDYEDRQPTTLLDPSCFISTLTTDPPILEANKYTQPLTDRQLISLISKETLN